MLKRFLPIWILVFYSFLGQSQSFNILPPQNINTPIGSQFGTICWGDFDNDNDLDILVTGKDDPRTYIFRNLGNDSFAVLNYNLPQVKGQAQFADFDNDGDLDIFISGNDQSQSITAVYKNTLPDSIGFVKVINSGNALLAINNAWLVIFDIDNDGDLDIFHYGYVPLLGNKEFYHLNQENNNFISQFVPYFPSYTFVNFFDFNKDGFMDAHRWNNHIYSNSADFNFQFSDSDSIQPCGLWNYIDFNLDGRIDIQAVGAPNSLDSNRFKIYQNYPTDSFGLNNASISGLPNNWNSNLRFLPLDANNDGFYDFFVSNDSDFYFYKNNPNNYLNFILDSSFNYNLNSIDILSTADYDNDGDLDVFASGEYNTWPYNFTTIFRNDSTPPNTPPTAPQVMWTEMDSSKIIFHWQPATDVETPQATLSYNLMVGTTPKGIDITSPLSDTVTGFRRVVELGNAQLNNFYILDKSNFALGDTIYWSVQTIDNGFGYSPFSRGNSAIVHQSMTLENKTLCSNTDSISWRGQFYDSAGIYFHGNGAISNFDSAFFLQLDTASAYLKEQLVDLCAGQSYNWQGQNYFNTGTYTVYNTTTAGCDSIERLVLKVHPTHTTVQNASICRGDSLALGSTWLKESGTYVDSLQSSFSCDSLVQLTLEVSPKDTVVLFSGDSLVAHSNTAGIRWWDCQNQTYVFNAYGKVFVPQQNGHYAAELTESGCSWLSQCFEITGTGIPSPKIPTLHIQPNPTSGKLNIEANTMIHHISLSNLQGKILMNFYNVHSTNFAMNISNLEKGVYLLKIEFENSVIIEKLVKE